MSAQKFLLDTNILLTALIKPEALDVEIQALLQNPKNSILFSTASIWEIAIKRSLGREDFNFMPEEIQHLAINTGFTELPIQSNHCFKLVDMPWHHRDPFDRLLVSQAQTIPAYLLTSDALLANYSELVRVVAINSTQVK
jgi:PIN domain nuclease of toxin-antitoxin system